MEREPQITFRNIAKSEALEGLIRERIAKLEKFHGHIVGVRVVVEEPHSAAEKGKAALQISLEVDVAGRPRIVVKRSEEQHEAKNDRYAFMNWAFDAAQRQLEDLAAKQNGQVKNHGPAGIAMPGTIARMFLDYGFIEVDNSPDLYFTRQSVNGLNFDELTPGTQVEVMPASAEGPMGPQASSVRPAGARK